MASNIADKTLFDNAFYKTVYQSKGFVSNGPELTYVTMTLKNAPRELKRIVLRTIRSGNEHMKEGQIEIYEVGDADPDVIEYYFEAVSHSQVLSMMIRLQQYFFLCVSWWWWCCCQVEDCALLVNFNWPAAGYTRQDNAEKVTVRPSTWYGFDKHGFKIDLFVQEIVVV